LVLDGCLDPHLVAEAERQELERAKLLRPHRSHREIKAESAGVVGVAAREILRSLVAPSFVDYLRGLTAIPSLVPDPSFHLAGLHVGRPGSFQAMHRDFRRHPVTGLNHRVNVLVYLNSDWSDSYGGNLELWPHDLSACGRRIRPDAGRMVIFETTASTLHAVPEPLACPDKRARLTLASYYYSPEPSDDDTRPPLLRRPRRPSDPWYVGFASPADAVTNTRVRLRIARRQVAARRPRQSREDTVASTHVLTVT
jgi:hypothetical protein